jgi:PhnB protein
MAESSQRVFPYLLYEDGAGAVDWLTRAFGFRERLLFNDPESGAVTHAELELDGARVMLGQPGGDYRSPKETGHSSVLVAVYVVDVDAHFEHAREAGAEIVHEPTDKPYGERAYMARDLEGQQWSFATVTAGVSPEEWGATVAKSS